jgi:hypothetical protein
MLFTWADVTAAIDVTEGKKLVDIFVHPLHCCFSEHVNRNANKNLYSSGLIYYREIAYALQIQESKYKTYSDRLRS